MKLKKVEYILFSHLYSSLSFQTPRISIEEYEDTTETSIEEHTGTKEKMMREKEVRKQSLRTHKNK